MKALAIASALALSACTTINEHVPPAPDFPSLRIVEHRVGFVDVLARCYKYQSAMMKVLGGIPLACSEFYFAERRCEVWYSAVTPSEGIEHEREHCAGYDHPGDDTVRAIWRNYRREGGR